MALRRAIGAVKDQTSISLAKVNNDSDSLSELEIAIVKVTRHEEYPAEERHVREILSLSHYSRHFVSACVGTIARRLNKTHNWVVALKSLMLIQRLLEDGEAEYEDEVAFATRRGTRLLNLSDFRDTTGRNGAWDYSAFVRTYALYLDEKLEFRMQGRRRKSSVGSDRDEEEEDVEKLIDKMLQLQQLLDRFLATRPAGATKSNRLALVALYPVVRESFKIYYDMTDILNLLVHKFMVDLDVTEAIRVHDILCRSSKQLDELDSYYTWCKEVGMTRASDYPEIQRISPKQLQKMDDFIHQKSSETVPLDLSLVLHYEAEAEDDLDSIRALPPVEESPVEDQKQDEKLEEKKPETPRQHEGDLLNLWDEPMTNEQHGDELSLVLFNGPRPGPGPLSGSVWDAYKVTSSDWEVELVQSTSYLPQQRTELGGGLDMLVLEGLYTQGTGPETSASHGSGDGTGSGQTKAVQIDPFGPSIAVPPPSYVQMSELEKKQRLMMEEQMMWQQYARNGMQGQNPHQNGCG